MKEIDLETILKDAWEAFQKNWQPLLIISGVLFLCPVIVVFVTLYFGVFAAMMAGQSGSENLAIGGFIGAWAVASLIIFVMQILSMGIIKVVLMIYNGKQVKFSDVWMDMNTYLRILGVEILTVLGGIAGFALCVLPIFVVAFLTTFACIIVVQDSSIGAWEAIKKSAVLAKENWKITLITVLLTLVIVSVLGYTGLGAVLVLPAQYLIYTALYLRLTNNGTLGAEPPALEA